MTRRDVKHGLVLVPERRTPFARLSVLDNVLFGAYGKTHSLATSRSAGTVSGWGSIAIDVCVEKLRSLAQGAAIATERLW